MPKKLRTLHFAILALGFIIFSVIFCYGSLLYWKVGFNLNHVVRYLYYDWEELKIKADEIPIYPNAKIISISYDKPAEYNHGFVTTWIFTTNDTPETVWKFYVDEMGRRWGFFEYPLKESPLRLIIVSCPTYELNMTNGSVDNNTYQVSVHFIIMACY